MYVFPIMFTLSLFAVSLRQLSFAAGNPRQRISFCSCALQASARCRLALFQAQKGGAYSLARPRAALAGLPSAQVATRTRERGKASLRPGAPALKTSLPLHFLRKCACRAKAQARRHSFEKICLLKPALAGGSAAIGCPCRAIAQAGNEREILVMPARLKRADDSFFFLETGKLPFPER